MLQTFLFCVSSFLIVSRSSAVDRELAQHVLFYFVLCVWTLLCVARILWGHLRCIDVCILIHKNVCHATWMRLVEHTMLHDPFKLFVISCDLTNRCCDVTSLYRTWRLMFLLLANDILCQTLLKCWSLPVVCLNPWIGTSVHYSIVMISNTITIDKLSTDQHVREKRFLSNVIALNYYVITHRF